MQSHVTYVNMEMPGVSKYTRAGFKHLEIFPGLVIDVPRNQLYNITPNYRNNTN